MREYLKFYINGEWVNPVEMKLLDVENPATERVVGKIALGSAVDVDKAVKAARQAFTSWSQTSREERLEVLGRILAEYQKRFGDLAAAVTEEMGAPVSLVQRAQVPLGMAHLAIAADVLKAFKFEDERGSTIIVREPIGVCSLITPGNWPLNQIACKVAPAIATGCTMILKPSELAPISGQIFAEIMHAAGVPAGVFNLIQGDGPGVGVPLSSHPDVDMVSFTGSTRAGIEVARNAAPTVKRVHQELGGKSANIVLDDDALSESVARGIGHMMTNSGQSCNAPTRMLVPAKRMGEAIAAAKQAAEQISVGDPNGNATMGPVVSKVQWDNIQGLIKKGIEEGATLVTGGPDRPDVLDKAYFVRPTVANVTNDMTIARLGYESLDRAVIVGTILSMAWRPM
jgi:aldehyde dehydrogenase (NAD+)